MGQKASGHHADPVSEDQPHPENLRIGKEGARLSHRARRTSRPARHRGADLGGMARAALEAVLPAYAAEQRAFAPIVDNQRSTSGFADMAMQVEAARQLVWHAASLKDAGKPCPRERPMAKLFALRRRARA